MAKAGKLQRKGTAAVTGGQARLYRLTGGRLGSTMNGRLVLLLTTTGRKSGVQRTRPVMFLRDDGRYVVCGTYAGSDSTPAWVLNLQAHPYATVELDGRTLRVTASEAEGTEYERLWTTFVSEIPHFEGYRTKTARHLPILVLTPVG